MERETGRYKWKVYTALSEQEKAQVEELALERDWSITKTLRWLVIAALASLT